MTIRNDNRKEIEFQSVDTITDRAELRKLMLCTFIKEDCKTKLRYFVETLSDGKRIYIERPAQLNKGCDFVIFVEDLLLFKNGNDKFPKHDDLLNDLQQKKQELSSTNYNLLIQAIYDIYNLKTFDKAFSNIANLPKVSGWSYELILKLSRWFFIEQDITYWAKSGREMLYNHIIEISK
ncbi:MAG: hypothetical protein ACOX4D_04230 [Bacteroidales bacterium]|jgi:hypothetical protein